MTTKEKPEEAPASRPLDLDECLSGIPCLNPEVERAYEPGSGYLLRWHDRPGPTVGWFKRLLWGKGKICRIALDEVGKRTVELIDGKREVDMIAEVLAKEFQFELPKAQAALLVFLSMLMKRNIVTVIASAKGK